MSEAVGQRVRWAIVVASLVLAAVSAKPYAGGWNDGSRLASVEVFGEQGHFRIDDSIFVRVSAELRPYAAAPEQLNQSGTLDKLWIDGHFYSDKPPVMTVLLGSVYRVSLWLGSPTARERPDWFCWWLTFLSAGGSYFLAVLGVHFFLIRLRLPPFLSVLLLGSFSFCTYAAAYTWHLNNHIVFLAVSAWLCHYLLTEAMTKQAALAIGALTGFGYTLDLGIGTALFPATFVALMMRKTSWKVIALVMLTAAPCVSLHHALNYLIGGSFGPANANPTHLNWPGSPFDARTMTGGFKHTLPQYLLYSLDLLFAKQGFFSHNLPLMLFPASALLVWRYQRNRRPFVAYVFIWFLFGWQAYAITSTNLSGACCSIRWFMPYLAPMFGVIALMLNESPRYGPDLYWLSGVGLVMGGLMCWHGPWTLRMVPGFWAWLGLAGLGWGVIRCWEYSRK